MHQWWIFYEVKLPGIYLSASKVLWPFLQDAPHVPELTIPEYFHLDGISWFCAPSGATVPQEFMKGGRRELN